jgi:hypothetical protein
MNLSLEGCIRSTQKQLGTWGTVSGFTLKRKKTTENVDQFGTVAGTSVYKLTSSQQSVIKYTNPNISPYLAVVFLKKVYRFFLHIFLFMCILLMSGERGSVIG